MLFLKLFSKTFRQMQEQIDALVKTNEENERTIKSLVTQNNNLKRANNSFKKLIEDLRTELSQYKPETPNTGDKEFITGDDEFKTGDKEFVVKEDTISKEEYEALRGEALLLAKELQHCWSLRLAHEEDKAGGFSFIEWGGVASNISRGLRAYLQENVDEYEQQDINWMFNMFNEFEGKL
jgi:regulator of replication initiation timing